MAFENSPKLDGNASRLIRPRPARNARRNARAWVWALVAANFLLGLFLAYTFVTGEVGVTYGGLDGCLVTPAGKPITTQVRIGQQVAATDSDGCFFFARLAPGAHTLEVSLTPTPWRQSVTIIAAKAVGLGAVIVDPAKGAQ